MVVMSSTIWYLHYNTPWSSCPPLFGTFTTTHHGRHVLHYLVPSLQHTMVVMSSTIWYLHYNTPWSSCPPLFGTFTTTHNGRHVLHYLVPSLQHTMVIMSSTISAGSAHVLTSGHGPPCFRRYVWVLGLHACIEGRQDRSLGDLCVLGLRTCVVG